GTGARCVQWSTYLIDQYGVSRFFTDIENGYRYPDPRSPAGTVTHTLLTWASNEGFRELCRELDMGDYESPLQFRQRFILEAIKQKGYFNGS
ncbi:hypothetical protein, partial [Kluyvera ascorbata]|uniref:hypothetical protein n=1 Tax=Kluyvera ascorbata TaxID=51288 RepID=UPI001C68BDA7